MAGLVALIALSAAPPISSAGGSKSSPLIGAAMAAQVLDHPAGGIGLGSKRCLVALFCQEGSFQLSEGQGPLFGVIGFQLLGQLADGGGEFLGLDPQLPEGARSLE